MRTHAVVGSIKYQSISDENPTASARRLKMDLWDKRKPKTHPFNIYTQMFQRLQWWSQSPTAQLPNTDVSSSAYPKIFLDKLKTKVSNPWPQNTKNLEKRRIPYGWLISKFSKDLKLLLKQKDHYNKWRIANDCSTYIVEEKTFCFMMIESCRFNWRLVCLYIDEST